MTYPLPGMPARLGDRGVFVCGPGDIAPWETGPALAEVTRPSVGPGPRAHGSRWLVLGLCPDCGPLYCSRHDQNNWWLTVYDGPPFTPKTRHT